MPVAEPPYATSPSYSTAKSRASTSMNDATGKPRPVRTRQGTHTHAAGRHKRYPALTALPLSMMNGTGTRGVRHGTTGRRRSREGNTRHPPISAEDGEQAGTVRCRAHAARQREKRRASREAPSLTASKATTSRDATTGGKTAIGQSAGGTHRDAYGLACRDARRSAMRRHEGENGEHSDERT